MSFPAGEHAALRKRLSQGKPIYTTRVQTERGKYREGQTVKSPFGLLRVTAVTKFDDIKKHPFKKELTAGQREEIGDQPFDHVRLEAESKVCGKCISLSLADIKKHPDRKLVMGPAWRASDSAHFWTEDAKGNVYDRYPNVPESYKHEGRIVSAKSVLAELDDDWGLMFTTVNARRSRGPCEIVCP